MLLVMAYLCLCLNSLAFLKLNLYGGRYVRWTTAYSMIHDGDKHTSQKQVHIAFMILYHTTNISNAIIVIWVYLIKFPAYYFPNLCQQNVESLASFVSSQASPIPPGPWRDFWRTMRRFKHGFFVWFQSHSEVVQRLIYCWSIFILFLPS